MGELLVGCNCEVVGLIVLLFGFMFIGLCYEVCWGLLLEVS